VLEKRRQVENLNSDQQEERKKLLQEIDQSKTIEESLRQQLALIEESKQAEHARLEKLEQEYKELEQQNRELNKKVVGKDADEKYIEQERVLQEKEGLIATLNSEMQQRKESTEVRESGLREA